MGDTAEPYFGEATEEANAVGWMGPADERPLYELAAGVTHRPVFGQNLMLNFIAHAPGTGSPPHAHPEEQMGLVLEGEIDFTIGDQTRVLRKGCVYVIPTNVPHGGWAGPEGCLLLDVFSPPRRGFQELIARANPLRNPARWWEPD